jgi:anti-sigma B factor antagonist
MMATAKATMTARKAGDNVSVIDIKGEVTAFAEDALMDAYTEANKGNPKVIILNFDELEYMNSSGIGLLVTLLIRANRQGQRILAVGLNEHYRHIFELTRLDEAIQICVDESEALEIARGAH